MDVYYFSRVTFLRLLFALKWENFTLYKIKAVQLTTTHLAFFSIFPSNSPFFDTYKNAEPSPATMTPMHIIPRKALYN